MNRRLSLLAVLAGLGCTGCGTFFEIAARNLYHVPVDGASDCKRDKRLYALAEEALGHYCAAHPDQVYSPDFACGFKDGFVDFIERGGIGEAPPNPPWHYKLARYDSPAGRQAQLDYDAGFREGSAVGRASGLRAFVVILPGQAPAASTDPDQRRNSADLISTPPMPPTTPGDGRPQLPVPNLEPGTGKAEFTAPEPLPGRNP